MNLQTDKSEYNSMYLVRWTHRPYYFYYCVMDAAVCKWKQVVNDPSD